MPRPSRRDTLGGDHKERRTPAVHPPPRETPKCIATKQGGKSDGIGRRALILKEPAGLD